MKVLEIADPQGGRNRIHAGDPVKVTRNPPTDASGFKAKFRYATVDDTTGVVTDITVVGGIKYDPTARAQSKSARIEWRTVRPERVHRMRAKAAA